MRNAVLPKQTIINKYEEYSIFNETYAKARAADPVLLPVYALLLHPDFDTLSHSLVSIDDDDIETIGQTVSGIVDALNPSRLAGLTLIDMSEISLNNPAMEKVAHELKKRMGTMSERNMRFFSVSTMSILPDLFPWFGMVNTGISNTCTIISPGAPRPWRRQHLRNMKSTREDFSVIWQCPCQSISIRFMHIP